MKFDADVPGIIHKEGEDGMQNLNRKIWQVEGRFEDFGGDGRIIIKYVLKMVVARIWIGIMTVKIGTSEW
jgi:hypothetical protein